MGKVPLKWLRGVAGILILLYLFGCGGGGIGAGFVFIEPLALPTFQTGLFYQIQFVAQNAAGNVTWSRTSGTLPRGLSMNMLGILTGTPVSSGTFTFTIRAVDSVGHVATRAYTATVSLSFNTLLVRTRDACGQPLANALVYLSSATPAPILKTLDATGEWAFLGVDPPYLVTVGFDDQNPATLNELKSYYLTAQHEIIVRFPVNASACTPAGSGGIGGTVTNFTGAGSTGAMVSPSSKAGLLQTEQDYTPLLISPATPGFHFTSVSPPGPYAVSAIGLDATGRANAFAIARNLNVVNGGQVTNVNLSLAAYTHAVGGPISYPPGAASMSSSLAYAGYQLNPEGLVVANTQSQTHLGFAPSSYQLNFPPGIVTSKDKGIVWIETIQTLDDNGNSNIRDDVDKRWLEVDGFTISVFNGTADVEHPVAFLPEPTLTAPAKGASIPVTPNVNWTIQATDGVAFHRIAFEQIVGSGSSFTTVPAWEVFVERTTPFTTGFNLPALPAQMQAIGGLVSGRSYMAEVASADIPAYVGAHGFDIQHPTQDFRVSLMRTGPVTVQ